TPARHRLVHAIRSGRTEVRPRFDDDDWEDEPQPGHSGDAWFDAFFSEGLITDVVMPLRSGKEASVYLCRANASVVGAALVVAKVFRPRDRRGFRNNAIYKHGQTLGKAREQRAVRGKTDFGRLVKRDGGDTGSSRSSRRCTQPGRTSLAP